MKIFLLVSRMNAGGAERVAATLVNAWVSQGNTVTLIPTYSGGKEECFYRLSECAKLIYLAEIAGRKGRDPLTYVKRLQALHQLVLQHRPDVIVSFLPNVNVMTVLATRGINVPVIVAEHIYPPMCEVGQIYKWLCRLAYPRASRIVMLTEEGRLWLDQHLPNTKAAVIPNPVSFPLSSGEPRLLPQQWLADSRKLLLAVGRLEHQKGFDLLLDAFASLATACPDWDLVILGAGSEQVALEAQREQLGLATRVSLPGRAGNMADWYRRADLYVMSSRFEGFPNTLMEAMAYGCAGVSYDCDTGPRELIRDGLDGVLVRPVGDTQALATALLQLMQQDNLRQTMAVYAQEIHERYALARVLEKWDELFQEVIHEIPR